MRSQNIIITESMLASNGKRFINYLIDLIPQYAISFGIGYASVYLAEYIGYYGLSDFLLDISFAEELLFNYVLLIFYYVLFESLTSKSLGKYATNTKVILQNGQEPTPKDILIRSFCRLIPFDALSFLGTKGKGWHDSISKTYVVDSEAFEAAKLLANELDQIGHLS